MIQVLQVGGNDHRLGAAVLARVARFADSDELGGSAALVEDLRRAFARADDSLLLVAFLDDTGQLVGHAACRLQSDGQRTWVLVHQAALDGPSGDALTRALELGDRWGRTHGASFMLMGATAHPRAWHRKYGFEVRRYVMVRPLMAHRPRRLYAAD